jgi:hypothetical protein
MKCPNYGESMHPGYVVAPRGDLLYGGGLRWFEGRVKKGPPIMREWTGEELDSSILISKYLEAYKRDSCNAVFIYLSGLPDKNNEDEPLQIPDFWNEDSTNDKPLEHE